MLKNDKLIVVRGPSWNWDLQDGGEGNTGETIQRKFELKKCIAVRWTNGKVRTYRMGHSNVYDLRVLDNSLQDNKHEFPCDNCKNGEILGIRYQCDICEGAISLCSRCYHSNKHNMRHSFSRYDTPWSQPHELILRIYSKPVELHEYSFWPSYYPDHLPILGHEGKEFIATMSLPVPFPLRIGDRVRVHAILKEFRKATKEPCTETMEQFNGEIGMLHYFTHDANIAILYKCCNYLITYKGTYVRYIEKCSPDLDDNHLYIDFEDEVAALALKASIRTVDECVLCSNASDQNVQFYPCNHIIACESCSAIMKKCLKCGVTIETRYTVDKSIIPYTKQVRLEERIKDLESKLSDDMIEKHACSICVENKKSVAFMCGHSCCKKCVRNLQSCHMCRKPIYESINFIESSENDYFR